MLILEEDHPFALAYKLVEEGKLDPWNVDIVELANAYLEEIKKAELLDLRVPARALMAASFLLKKKLQVLFPEPKRKVERRRYTLEEIVELFEQENPTENLSEWSPPPEERQAKRTPRTRRNTTERKPQRPFPVHISKFEDALEEILHMIQKGVKSFTLREVAKQRSVVPYLMAVMALLYDGKVDVYQRDRTDLEVFVP